MKSTRKYHKRFTDKEPYRWLYTTLQTSARKHGKEFQLTFSEFLEFVNVKVCHYCGTLITWPERSRYLNDRQDKTLRSKSAYYLDRKDNSVGYTKNNCVVCCPLCNGIKGNKLTYSEMVLLGNGVSQIQQLRSDGVRS